MRPIEALTTWSRACAQADIPWYLYRETLLCANGYHTLPDTLTCAQVAVYAKDLPAIVNRILPATFPELTLNQTEFVQKRSPLCLLADNQPVFSIDVLCSVEDEAQIEALAQTIQGICGKVCKKISYRNFFGKILGVKLCRPFQNTVAGKGKIEKAFSALIALAGANSGSALFLCDTFTSKHRDLMSREMFGQTVMITCEEYAFPAFCGYRGYLSAVYGDYENGLTDDIGVGLTVEEKEELRRHQDHCMQVLAFLQELSQEFALRYYLLAGSVLGSKRHGGFIPWDDDVDVGIRVEELERFEALVKEHLPQRLPAGFELVQSGPNNPYPRMFSKICYEGRCCIDLWPLVPTYVHGNKGRFTWYFAKIITKVHYLKIGHPVKRFLKVAKPMAFLLSDRQVMTLARWNERKYAGKNTPAYINLYSIYRRGKETILREWLDTPATLTFDGLEVPVVGCTEEYLTHLYGDYMQYPAPWKRTSRHMARFTSEPTDSAVELAGAVRN